MIEGYSAITQSFLGSLFTWFLTAVGAALVFVLRGEQRKILDASLGFAAGVMLAASYWSLLAPALELSAEQSHIYGEYPCVPVTIGFILGAGFVYVTDILLPYISPSSNSDIVFHKSKLDDMTTDGTARYVHDKYNGITSPTNGYYYDAVEGTGGGVSSVVYRTQASRDSSYQIDGSTSTNVINRRDYGRNGLSSQNQYNNNVLVTPAQYDMVTQTQSHSHGHTTWRRILLLIIAVTVHNIPEGLAVGVGFGAVGKTSSATFQNARNLAIGIGIQNFPEGLAVSLPLMGAGYSKMRSFWYGQLSGMVEPVAALLGAVAMTVAEPLLPYALSFAAGAMIYVVIDDIIPETAMHTRSGASNAVCSWSAIAGFVIMMVLDTTLG